MKAEIHSNGKSTELHYLELEPIGMNQFAPRSGYYKVIRKCKVLIPNYALDGVCVHWKLNLVDEFDIDFETKIQLASFERNPYPSSSDLLKTDLTNRIIHVKGALKDSTGKFIVNWEILSNRNQILNLDQLNGMVNNSRAMDEFLSNDSLNDADLECYDDY